MDTRALTYQSNVLVAGQWMACVENYESIFERMRDANFKMTLGESSDTDGAMKFAAPIELTVAGFGNEKTRPTRIAVQPMALTAVLEIPLEQQSEVEFGE